MAFLQRNKLQPYQFEAEVTFTGSTLLELPVPRKIKHVQVMQLASSAPGSDYFTIEYTDENKQSFTLYSWLNNAASVAPATVQVLVYSE